MNWSQLSDKQKTAVKSAYESGKEPGAIAPTFGLKPKQVSDQAYRKKWKKVGKKSGKKGGAKRKTNRPSAAKGARGGKGKSAKSARKPASRGKKNTARRR